MSEDTPNLNLETPEEAPENGLPGLLARVVIISLVLLCMLLSGFGNIVTWTNGVEGVDYAIAFGTGIISEVIGAVLLVVIIWCLARPNVPRLLMALLFLPVWGMATFQNASASWSYYVEASNADEVLLAQSRALATKQALTTQANLSKERIEEIKKELDFIGMTRTPEEIRAERDRLPENYATKRAGLTAELNKAERRISLDTELTEQRSILSQTAGAGAIAGTPVGNKAKASTKTGASPLSASEITDVWSFLQYVQTNRLGSLVIVMEVMKSFGLLLVNVVFSGETRRKSKQKANVRYARAVQAHRQDLDTALEVRPTLAASVPTSAAWDAHRAQTNAAGEAAPMPVQASAKVIPMTPPVQSKPIAPTQAETAQVNTPKLTNSSIQFADEEPVPVPVELDLQAAESDAPEARKQGGIGISSKFV